MNKPLRIFFVAASLVLALSVMFLLGHSSRTRNHLLRYQAQLRASGEKLTFAELVPSPATNSGDCLAALTNAVAKITSVQFQPSLINLRKFVGPGRAQVAWAGDHPNWSAQSAPPAWAEMEEEIESTKPAVAQIRKALENPAPASNSYTNLWNGGPRPWVFIRTAAQRLSGDAIYQIHQGRLEDALLDLEALAALARLNRDDYALISQMIRIAVAGLGFAATWEVLQAPGWTEPQLLRLQNAWAAVDLADAVEKGLLGERAIGFELASLARSSGLRQTRKVLNFPSLGPASTRNLEVVLADYIVFPAYRATSMDADELFRLKALQDVITASRSLKTHRPWKEAAASMDKTLAEISQISRSPMRFRYWFSLISIPNFKKAGSQGVTQETERQMTIAAIALKRFELRYRKYPQTLEGLIPEFLPALPQDGFSGKPLCYRPNDDGSFVLYSVGNDGKDDGGDPRPASGGANGLWEGRDAVWPVRALQTP